MSDKKTNIIEISDLNKWYGDFHALKNINKKKWYDTPSYIFNIGFGWFRKHIFRNNMKLIIKVRYPVLAFTFVVLASQAVLFLNGRVLWRFFNAPA